jgi:UDP-N-acetylmuramoylalanine--D-glutamate ligase
MMATLENGTAKGVPEVRGKRVLVYSLGIEGRDLAKWLLDRGASVVMSDTRSDALLQAAGATAPEGVERTVTGGALLDPAGFDLLAVSQSVLRHDRALARARELGVPITSQMRLFLQLVKGRVIGITGSSGKSTTTALVADMARQAEVEFVVGGNIGEALLSRVDEIPETATVVLEISHTQLQYTDRSPHIAAVTNVTPNHLDQFNWDEYVGLKRNILSMQARDDIAVMNNDDRHSRALVASVKGKLWRTSLRGPVDGRGAWLENDTIVARSGQHGEEVVRAGDVQLRGRHNLANVVMACAIAAAAGWPVDAMRTTARTFRGVPHRLEVVGRAAGVTWINDSIATSPERTIAGLQAFTEPVVLLLGGREKNLPLDELQAVARERCRAVVCFGEAGPLFHEVLQGFAETNRLVPALEDAVAAASKLARSGDIVLLAPAGTSFDAYPSFEARGMRFRELVRRLPGFEEVTP